MKTIKTTSPYLLTLALMMTSSFVVEAQEPTIDLKARKATIPVIEKRIEERKAQILEITNDILKVHQRLDEKLNRLVKRLSGIKDSAKSGYRVGKLKMEAIATLKETVETFQQRRAALARELKVGRTGIPKNQVADEIEHFDEHTEMHFKQMLELSKSFTQDENVEKYKSTGGTGYYDGGIGWYEESVEISDEWRQNRRDRIMDKKQRADVLGAMKKSIARCESRVGTMKSYLKDTKLTEADRGVMKEELDVHVAMLKTRRQQMDELLVVGKPETVEVNRNVARDLEEALGDLIEDMQRDLRVIILKHGELNREQLKLSKVQSNLDARKKWLEKYEASQPK